MVDFKVMTWNVENLYPVGSEFGPTTKKVYDQKQAHLAQRIRDIDVDVIALQEIGSQQTFLDLQAGLGGNYPHAELSPQPDGRGIRVGFLSKLPLSNVQSISNFPDGGLSLTPRAIGSSATDPANTPLNAMGRGALKVTATLSNGTTINLITTHLKSKLISYPPDANGKQRFQPKDEDERARFTGLALLKRTVEALALRVHANDLTVGATPPCILLGDLNDGPEALTTQILLGPPGGQINPSPNSNQSNDSRLHNLANRIPEERRFSRITDGRKELIDHILVSIELVFMRREVDSFVEDIGSIGANPASRRNAVVPDHAPVFARFEIP
ncbi:MAG: endonuclease/exonuclease/phosphatase family protein [Chloroflexota bacterium]|nr:endonuclease/exonuclease/phosphatase family protein [Chloroflexota bacterium]